MRHDDRRVFTVQTVMVLGCAEKAELSQELAHKGSPALEREGAILQFRAGR
jgi:hypothetical protein